MVNMLLDVSVTVMGPATAPPVTVPPVATLMVPGPVSTLVTIRGCGAWKVTVKMLPAWVTVAVPPLPGSALMAFRMVVSSAAVPAQVSGVLVVPSKLRS